MATLQHPTIPDVYDFFSEADRSYLVMEFIRGKDLEATLDERHQPIDQEVALSWAMQICEVLVFLHSNQPRPIVFRDLKPSNIMLDHNGRIRVIDFGIAKLFHQQPGIKGTMIGTEGYSPPEQYRGEASPAGDIYAFGATFHHLLTLKDPRLQPPFSWQERPISHFNQDITPAFEAIIMRCLSYKPEDRFKNAMVLEEALKLVDSSDASKIYGTTPTDIIDVQAPAIITTSDAQDEEEETRLEGTVQPLWRFQCEDEIRSQPVVADNTVYVGTYDNNLYALSTQDGTFRWKYPASDGIGTSPFTEPWVLEPLALAPRESVRADRLRAGRHCLSP